MICKICKIKFTPLEENHTICPTCYHKTKRKCKKCGKAIWELPKYYQYCEQCFSEMVK